MNLFDLALAAVLGLGAWGGWRLGLVRGELDAVLANGLGATKALDTGPCLRG